MGATRHPLNIKGVNCCNEFTIICWLGSLPGC